ncbi:hypothetical protein OEA41_006230 [Lepraria neglecta]|uniref:AVL9/DENND6 domain-containing protein n=1 Tax=Lepraria neglecta TaxID=209136 RepID=A0AAD9Z785_9LECA|nr:hypothetical protein OEA41_006230 [Lepraria neglecta]
MAPSSSSFAPIVCVVGFHHARGPEIESWFGVEDGTDPAADNDWSFLPFMALSDGAHASTEDFSYFTLRRRATETSPPTSVFGISCTRQIDANQLHNRPADVTRSTVQKAVVAIADSPQFFGQLREKLSMVTGAWFAQKYGELDQVTISITSSSLRTALALSAADRRWIDFLSTTVHDTWDEAYPSRPKTMGYMGSEEFIRLQFEEYLLALLSTTKYHLYLQSHPPLPSIEGDPTTDFNPDFLSHWQQTSSFALFNSNTESHLFDIVEPRHPTAGNLSFEDIQRRFAMQIQTLHLDERLATSKEALNKHLATGHKKVSTAFSNLWADIEAMREAQRKRAEAAHVAALKDGKEGTGTGTNGTSSSPPPDPNAKLRVDLTAAQVSVQAAGQKAGAYISSWGAWASERRRGWAEGRANTRNEDVGAGAGAGAGEKSPGKLARWNSSASGKMKEEKGGDGIGRLDA